MRAGRGLRILGPAATPPGDTCQGYSATEEAPRTRRSSSGPCAWHGVPPTGTHRCSSCVTGAARPLQPREWSWDLPPQERPGLDLSARPILGDCRQDGLSITLSMALVTRQRKKNYFFSK